MGTMPKLTALKVRSLKKPGRYADGNNLYLFIKPSGTKFWVQRIVINGRRRDLSLGPVNLVSLAEARQIAEQNKRIVRAGADPTAKPTDAAVPTFTEAANQYHQLRAPTWRAPKVQTNWLRRLEIYAFPSIGHLPIDQITPTHILDILLPIWTTKPETARKVRQYISAVFRAARSYQWTNDNPAGEVIADALPNRHHLTSHHRALHYQDAASALGTIAATKAHPSAKLCFRFMVLTAARPGEARQATWDDLQIFANNTEWRVPPHKMKSAKLHRVPLSIQAQMVLEKARLFQTDSPLIFPSLHSKPMSNSTLSKLLRENGIAAVPHGFRSTFRDWGSEFLRANPDALELCLAHEIGDATRRSYARSDLFEERREIMEAWGTYLTNAC